MQVPTPYPTALFIREKALVINLESIRMIISADQVNLYSDMPSHHSFPARLALTLREPLSDLQVYFNLLPFSVYSSGSHAFSISSMMHTTLQRMHA